MRLRKLYNSSHKDCLVIKKPIQVVLKISLNFLCSSNFFRTFTVEGQKEISDAEKG